MMSPVTSKQHLRQLATLRPDGHKVLSVYLNLDPSELPTQRDRKIEIESLLDVAERALRDDGLPHEQRDELRRDVERIRAWFDHEFDASGARGVALFASSGIDLFEVVRLGRPIRSEVTIDDSPFIEPLAGMPGEDGYGVLLINRCTTPRLKSLKSSSLACLRWSFTSFWIPRWKRACDHPPWSCQGCTSSAKLITSRI